MSILSIADGWCDILAYLKSTIPRKTVGLSSAHLWYPRLHCIYLWYPRLHCIYLWYPRLHCIYLWYPRLHCIYLWYPRLHCIYLWYPRLHCIYLWYPRLHCIYLWYPRLHCIYLWLWCLRLPCICLWCPHHLLSTYLDYREGAMMSVLNQYRVRWSIRPKLDPETILIRSHQSDLYNFVFTLWMYAQRILLLTTMSWSLLWHWGANRLENAYMTFLSISLAFCPALIWVFDRILGFIVWKVNGMYGVFVIPILTKCRKISLCCVLYVYILLYVSAVYHMCPCYLFFSRFEVAKAK